MKTRVQSNDSDKVPSGSKRSNHWPIARKQHLKNNPDCAVCGGNTKIEVHHIRPFHLHPDLELDPNNLITLCENGKDGVNCHLLFGHLGNFKSFNVNVISQSAEWKKQIEDRPLSENETEEKKAA
jgi:predicted TIM-barrel fold metal-dependent hydrolase